MKKQVCINDVLHSVLWKCMCPSR